MTIQVANTELSSDTFNTWRLNTNYLATIVSNNVITLGKYGRGGTSTGDGHVVGTFSANSLRSSVLQGGNTTSSQPLTISSNTIFSGTRVVFNANTEFTGNINFTTSGTDRLILGDASRIRISGGANGQFIRVVNSDVLDFESLKARDITNWTINFSDITLSGSNASFSNNGDTPKLVFSSGSGNTVSLYGTGTDDLYVKLADSVGSSLFAITDNSNTVVTTINSDGHIIATNVTLANSSISTTGDITGKSVTLANSSITSDGVITSKSIILQSSSINANGDITGRILTLANSSISAIGDITGRSLTLSEGSISQSGVITGSSVVLANSSIDSLGTATLKGIVLPGGDIQTQINILAAANNVQYSSANGSALIPSGTEAERDSVPHAGYFRFNIDNSKFEGYNGTTWGSVGGGATGGAGNEVFIENDNIVTQDYTIPVGRNAMSTGPIEVANGVTVTVSSGSRWVVI